MSITEYKIVVGTNTSEIESVISADGLSPIGNVDASFDGAYALQAAGVGSYDFGNATDYWLVQGKTCAELESAVNAKIADGFQPVGGVLSWHDAFIQAVGKVDASGGGSGGSGGDLPTGNQYEVASFNKSTGAMEAVKMNMNIWTGADLPRYDAAMSLIPLTNFAAGGLSSTQGYVAVDTLPSRFAVAQRDMNGCLGVERAIEQYHATNLQQVEEMIATSRKAIEDGIIDIINGAINGG